ncbi:MAG: hypothetical protein FH761_17855 [Firmicutes bacterium]|nr:hypothetical protein [Bacillota bacterium]
MAIKVKANIRHDGTMYHPGDVIEQIKKEDEERLIKLGIGEKTDSKGSNKKSSKNDKDTEKEDSKEDNKKKKS